MNTLFDYYPDKQEKPLEKILPNGGMCAIFHKIAVVGDSLSAGEFESLEDGGKIEYRDFYEQSWGEYLARLTGAEVVNFSRGGMTAMEYCEEWAERNGFWDPKYQSEAYIVALGVNDLCNYEHPVGSIEDICREDWRKNNRSFIGYYAQILQRYREISPKSMFFLTTIPRQQSRIEQGQGKWIEAQKKAVEEIAAFFENTYVLDLYTYAPPYDEEFEKNFFLGGHMAPAGYLFTSRMIAAYIDFIIRNQPEEFKEAGFILTPYQYDETKKFPFRLYL